MPSILWSVTLVIIGSTLGTSARPKLFLNLSHTSTTEGYSVELYCISTARLPTVKWIKEGFGSEFYKHNGPWRFSLFGSDTMKFRLEISPVVAEDQGKYMCEADLGAGQEPIRSTYATLTVYVPPQRPKILLNNQTVNRAVLELGKETELTCVAERGRPEPTVSWRDENDKIIEQNVRTHVLPHGDTFSVKSVLKIKPELHHHNKSLSCCTFNNAHYSHSQTYILLLVESRQIAQNSTERDVKETKVTEDGDVENKNSTVNYLEETKVTEDEDVENKNSTVKYLEETKVTEDGDVEDKNSTVNYLEETKVTEDKDVEDKNSTVTYLEESKVTEDEDVVERRNITVRDMKESKVSEGKFVVEIKAFIVSVSQRFYITLAAVVSGVCMSGIPVIVILMLKSKKKCACCQ